MSEKNKIIFRGSVSDFMTDLKDIMNEDDLNSLYFKLFEYLNKGLDEV